MKKALLPLLLLCVSFFTACKKESLATYQDPATEKIKIFVRSQVTEEVYEQLDWGHLKFYDRNGVHEIAKISVKSNDTGTIAGKTGGLYVSITKEGFTGTFFEINKSGKEEYAVKTSLNGTEKTIARIENGWYDGNYKIYNNGILIAESKQNTSLVAYPSPVEVTFETDNEFYFLIDLLNVGGNFSMTGSELLWILGYLEIDLGNSANNAPEEILEFEYNDWTLKDNKDITKLFNCFDLVPGGPTCKFEITLNADIPANKNEGIPVFGNGNPGHVFLTVTKKNGSQSVTQNFGFYPEVGPKSLALNDVNSKIKDDGNHEINASIKMDINEASFNLIRANAIYWATKKYNLESYNCANFAIDLFNLARYGSEITVPSFLVTIPPTSLTPGFTALMNKSPQMLFATLKEMKNSGHVEATSIRIDRSGNYKSNTSHDECP